MNSTLKIAQPRLRLEEPHNCTDSKEVLSVLETLFESLVKFDHHLRYAPALATAWTVSPDARTWTFHLREGATFHNSEPCDGEAVKYSLERMARPDMGATLGAPAVYHQYLDGMQVELPDRQTVRLTTPQPMADLLDVLVTGYILPPKATERLGNAFSEEPIGSGPYQFASFDGARLHLKRHEAYQPRRPQYDKIEWLALPNPAERLRQVAQGHLHIATAIPPELLPAPDSVHIQQTRGTTAYIIMLNAATGPLQDPRLRLALNLGINRQAIIDDVLSGTGYPLAGFISPIHFGANPKQNELTFNPSRAQELLAEAGYGHGLTLTLDSPTALPDEAVRLSQVVTEQLGQIGVTIETVYTEDRVAYANSVRLKQIHDMCIFDSSPLSTYRVLKEKVDARFAGSWWQGYQNERVETLLDEAETTTDEAAREATYRACYDLLCDDPPWIYLYNRGLITAVSPHLNNWQLTPHGLVSPP